MENTATLQAIVKTKDGKYRVYVRGLVWNSSCKNWTTVEDEEFIQSGFERCELGKFRFDGNMPWMLEDDEEELVSQEIYEIEYDLFSIQQ